MLSDKIRKKCSGCYHWFSRAWRQKIQFNARPFCRVSPLTIYGHFGKLASTLADMNESRSDWNYFRKCRLIAPFIFIRHRCGGFSIFYRKKTRPNITFRLFEYDLKKRARGNSCAGKNKPIVSWGFATLVGRDWEHCSMRGSICVDRKGLYWQIWCYFVFFNDCRCVHVVIVRKRTISCRQINVRFRPPKENSRV